MQQELKLSDWDTDELTGYLRHKSIKTAITPEMKVTYLEALKKLGTESGAARFAGFSPRLLAVHKRADRQFREDCLDAMKEMADTLEGVMYLRAQKDNGTLDRFGWLRAHFPAKWSPKGQAEEKVDKKVIDDLWKEANRGK